MMNRTKLLLVSCLTVGLLSLTACSIFGNGQATGVDSDSQIIVAARAEARWKALIGGDLDQAYTFLSPATRKIMTMQQHRARIKPGMWRDAKVISVDCTDELCRPKVMLKYDIRNIKGIEMELEESWIKEGGNWWYVQKR